MADPDGYVGEIRLFAGFYAPTGWAFCDGRSLERDSYLNLYSVIAYTYGGGGSSFKLPDLRGRVPVHTGTGPGLTPRSCGQSFGEEMAPLTAANIAKHNHEILLCGDDEATSNSPEGNYLTTSQKFCMYRREMGSMVPLHPDTIGKVGSGSCPKHKNMMPSQCINYIIALKGTLPSGEQE